MTKQTKLSEKQEEALRVITYSAEDGGLQYFELCTKRGYEFSPRTVESLHRKNLIKVVDGYYLPVDEPKDRREKPADTCDTCEAIKPKYDMIDGRCSACFRESFLNGAKQMSDYQFQIRWDETGNTPGWYIEVTRDGRYVTDSEKFGFPVDVDDFGADESEALKDELFAAF